MIRPGLKPFASYPLPHPRRFPRLKRVNEKCYYIKVHLPCGGTEMLKSNKTKPAVSSMEKIL